MNKELINIIQAVNTKIDLSSCLEDLLKGLAVILCEHTGAKSVTGSLWFNRQRVDFSTHDCSVVTDDFPLDSTKLPSVAKDKLIIAPVFCAPYPNFTGVITFEETKSNLTEALSWVISFLFSRLLGSEASYSAVQSAAHDTLFYLQNEDKKLDSLEQKIRHAGNYQRLVSLPLKDDREELDLSVEMQECIENFKRFFEHKSLSINKHLSPNLVFCSKKLLTIALENIVSNAIKHSSNKDEVKIFIEDKSVKCGNPSQANASDLNKLLTPDTKHGLEILKSATERMKAQFQFVNEDNYIFAVLSFPSQNQNTTKGHF